MTCSCSKYTMNPGYSQREIGGVPTAGTLLAGAPNLPATWSMVMPRLGGALSEGLTAMPLSTAMVSAPARPLASTAASSRIRYLMAYLICYRYPMITYGALKECPLKLYHFLYLPILASITPLLSLPFKGSV